MPPALTAPVLVAAALLVAAAPGKLRRPGDTVTALRAVGLPAARSGVRALAVGELGLAMAVLIVPSPVVLLALAAAYAGFAVFVALALRAGTPLASCGCLGRPDTPPTRPHLVVVAALGAASLGAAVTGAASAPALLAEPGAGLPLLLAAGVGGYLAWAVLAVLPHVLVAGRAAPSTATFRAVGA
ncbi:MAG TPA: MauE/DoxX family redox-associated membrane protein [Mycobacteriales bacterium]|nr:MauE/DoxX family redox-associated membrane protein [Mycobacteriales bacterium]